MEFDPKTAISGYCGKQPKGGYGYMGGQLTQQQVQIQIEVVKVKCYQIHSNILNALHKYCSFLLHGTAHQVAISLSNLEYQLQTVPSFYHYLPNDYQVPKEAIYDIMKEIGAKVRYEKASFPKEIEYYINFYTQTLMGKPQTPLELKTEHIDLGKVDDKVMEGEIGKVMGGLAGERKKLKTLEKRVLEDAKKGKSVKYNEVIAADIEGEYYKLIGKIELAQKEVPLRTEYIYSLKKLLSNYGQLAELYGIPLKY